MNLRRHFWLNGFAAIVLSGAIGASARAGESVRPSGPIDVSGQSSRQPILELSLTKEQPADSTPPSTAKTAWKKGAFAITPYGSLWANVYYGTQRTFPGEFTFWVFSEESQPEDAFTIDARRTRIGADITGPSVDLWQEFETGGKVELDFLGQFLTENGAGARIRHAWWEAHNDNYRVMIGQNWDVISPLHPGTLNFTVGWNSGNIGFRRAQIRLERFVQINKYWQLTLQGSANQDIIADFPTDPGVRRETADWPVFQGRAAVSFDSPAREDQLFTVGVSGHIGEVGFDFTDTGPPPVNLPPANNVRIPTWSVNLDARIELADIVIQGEIFRGANLSAFLGGIGQGVCPCLREPIHSSGGWIETVFIWTPQWESHVGVGVDDPDDSDSLLGRTFNRFIFGNLIWNVTEQLKTGVELTFWKTEYQETRKGLIDPALLSPSAPGRATTVEWMVRYDF